MNKNFIYIILHIISSILGEFLLKTGASQLQLNHHLSTWFIQVLNPYIISGILFAILAGTFLIIAFSKFELSFIYPFLSINYILVIVGAKLFLNEPLTIARLVSITLIGLGLWVISRSPYASSHSTQTHQETLTNPPTPV